MIQVAEGKIPYTIANSIDVAAAQQIRPNLAIAFDLTEAAHEKRQTTTNGIESMVF